ncbi:NAD(P)H-dependent oxidoreductase [Candidatus Woesearchaeota archaeon]|nr:NAD(P)H-dependent oxidoreductase [Candidatus Woesearchaeota archaeon]
MRTLIVYAHPQTKGHCPLILEGIENWHKQHQIDYEVIDLYRIKYDPVLHEEEHYTAGNREISEQNREFQQKISETTKLIFIYPMWWGYVPAILKGFFDRVFTSNFAFRYEGNKPIAMLKGKKAALLVTSGGPKIIYKLLLDMPNTLIKLIVFRFCGIKSKVFQVDKARILNDTQVKKIKKESSKAMKYLYF